MGLTEALKPRSHLVLPPDPTLREEPKNLPRKVVACEIIDLIRVPSMKTSSLFWILACFVIAFASFSAGMGFVHVKSAATRPQKPPTMAKLYRVGDQVALVLSGYGQSGPKTIIA